MKVAIDGPAGSGKSTVAKLVAQNLGFKHIDTGAYYRWVTYNTIANKISLSDAENVVKLSRTLDFMNIPDDKIRTVAISNNVSIVATYKEVRKVVVEQQRKAAEKYDVVMEGRDIGSVVFPDAEVKIFLNASVEARALRRHKELSGKGDKTDLLEIKAEIAKRDFMDSTREHSPLKKTADALEIDTTGLSIDQVVTKIIKIVEDENCG